MFFQYFRISMAFFSIITVVTFVGTMLSITGGAGNRTFLVNTLLGLSFAYLVAKLFAVGVFLITDLVWGIEYAFSSLTKSTSDPSRRSFLINAGLLLGAFPMVGLIYGMVSNKYNYRVRNLTLSFPDLPKKFEGYKILQISDIHSGSFDNIKALSEGIDLINKQQADVVLFTGDLVNDHPDEIDPYIDVFNKIKAKDGVFSTSGNHDYHYLQRDPSASYSLLESKHRKLGFNMLNNQHVKISRGEENIVIAGVENWGVPPFPQKGDLNKAFENLEEKEFTVLMSHDPSHWDAEVRTHKKHVHLTLSGHTHGMQFGIDNKWVKWSPVKWKYPRWADLYTEEKQHLYVNRGFGFIGYPGRVGVLPEITVIELRTS